ncbi:MAG: hypothetical protein LBI44_06650 [Oscillospiraceae bacterium]|nr:hypothetical protein [Oscillospiraceae bacterium]
MGAENNSKPARDEAKVGTKSAKKPVKRFSAARWIILIVGWTFVLSVLLSFVSQSTVPHMSFMPALLVLLSFIALGVAFDIIGFSVATANEKPFHAMAANKVRGADRAIWLLRRADKVSCFCGDVVGDITGIISGATASVIVTNALTGPEAPNLLTQLVFSAVVASVTVGSKALGKAVSLRHNVKIVAFAGRLISYAGPFTKKTRKAGKDTR